MERVIEVKGIKKAFGDHEVLKGVDFAANKGEVTCIIGSSGSGKSTLLRCINLLETPDEGQILYHGEDILSGAVNMPRYHAKVGMVFQQFNLFGNMDVLNNCVTGQRKVLHRTREESVENAMKYLKKVGMDAYINAKPRQLSGGQKQRVAIARALATNPKVLLCDEATSALDPKTTRQILELIGDINKKLGITVVIITHQMSVVKSVCNHVAILDDGEVVEDGLVSTVFSAPKSAAARHLVFPGGADVTVSDPTQERRIRLIFRSAKTTSIPLVARLATEENIAANVISASTQKLSEEIYGSMLLGVPAAQFDRAWEFLSGIENLQVEEASVGVQ
mgnify:CR=1 FL=1